MIKASSDKYDYKVDKYVCAPNLYALYRKNKNSSAWGVLYVNIYSMECENKMKEYIKEDNENGEER